LKRVAACESRVFPRWRSVSARSPFAIPRWPHLVSRWPSLACERQSVTSGWPCFSSHWHGDGFFFPRAVPRSRSRGRSDRSRFDPSPSRSSPLLRHFSGAERRAPGRTLSGQLSAISR
jgi:hypothetical protein